MRIQSTFSMGSLIIATLSVMTLLPAMAPAATTRSTASDSAMAMSRDAVIASGTCIAQYAAMLDDESRPAAEIGQRIAKRCAGAMSRSARLTAQLAGKPQDYQANLRYLREDLTTNAVVRIRAAKHPPN